MKNLFMCLIIFGLASCSEENLPTQSFSGINKTDAEVKTQSSGLTYEQENVKKRLEDENTVGAVKHLYIISAYSGDVILYSTVKGKATSSGKRLSPSVLQHIRNYYGKYFVIEQEVLGDDGTYGNSSEYIYWWDIRGIYHQHYPSGGQIIHISDQPMDWPKIILNLEKIEKAK